MNMDDVRMGGSSARHLRQRPLLIVGAIAAAALLLSLMVYAIFQTTNERIVDTARTETRTSVKIQAHDMANSLSNEISGILDNLAIISASPAVQSGNAEQAKPLFSRAQASTNLVTDFYGWLGKDGKIVWLSIASEDPSYLRFIGADRGGQEWFAGARQAKEGSYVGTVTDSIDNKKRLFLANAIYYDETGEFKGSCTPRYRSKNWTSL